MTVSRDLGRVALLVRTDQSEYEEVNLWLKIKNMISYHELW